MRRGIVRTLAVASVLAGSLAAAAPAQACGGLIGPNGAVNLLRTSTLAGYSNGVEHYVTSFKFAGGGGAFGSIVPLPGVPTSVVRGGDWTLQRLDRETDRFRKFALSDAAGGGSAPSPTAEVLLETKVDALDITVLRGGGPAVGTWATEHGFRLSPDTPEVLDFYADRGAVFLAASFDASRAKKKGQRIGDGTPVHVTIPTSNPWVPLRILGLGKPALEPVEADVYLLTPQRPALLGDRQQGINKIIDEQASALLLKDLHDDKGGRWVKTSRMWLTKLAINSPAGKLKHDLAIDVTDRREPSRFAAGYAMAANAFAAPESLPLPLPLNRDSGPAWWAIVLAAGTLLAAAGWTARRMLRVRA
jgi:hypothetical protein